MSGFAAIFRFDGGPVDSEAIRRMTGAMSYRGPDGITHWTGQGAALGHCRMHATAESLTEEQPLADETGKLHLVMDGWLANPDELRTDLLERGARLRDTSDAELVLKAFEAWGHDCCNHIDGEYAFVIWDADKRQAFAARDHAGLRPLHYHWDGKRLLIASDIAGVLAACDIDARLNPGMVAEHLASEFYSLDETLWQGVMRLPLAHVMSIDRSGPRISRYWSPPFEADLRYPQEKDYHEHYRELLIDSVRRASRSHLPIGCGVSGGLDSSAIYGAAQHLLREGGFLAPAIEGYTYYLDPAAYPETDEMAFVEAVERHWGTRIERITPFIADSLEWYAQRGRADRDMPTYPNAAMIEAVRGFCASRGSRVVMNGEGGDLLLTGTRTYYADQISSFDLKALRTSLAADIATIGPLAAARAMFRYGVVSNLPQGMRAALRRRKLKRQDNWIGMDLAWISADARAELIERRVRHFEEMRRTPYRGSRRALYNSFIGGFSSYINDVQSRGAARAGYEPRTPYLSRDMVDFVFRMPEHLRLRGVTTKYFHRLSLRDNLLPKTVSDRQTKAYYESPHRPLLNDLRKHVSDCIVQCGITGLNAEGVLRLASPVAEDEIGGLPVYELWAVFGLMVHDDTGSVPPALTRAS